MAEKGRFTGVSIGLLPIEDIVKTLQIGYQFATKEDFELGEEDYTSLALAGSRSPAEAEDSKGNYLPAARRTVENAERLGGRKANEFLTVTDKEMFDVYSREIINLRDELMQLKAALAREGTVPNYDSYAGFVEAFNPFDVMYVEKTVGNLKQTAESNTELIVTDKTLIEIFKDDHFVVEPVDNLAEPSILQAKAVAGDRILVENKGMRYFPEDVRLKKTLGGYRKGSFTFVRELGNSYGDLIFSGQTDDTYKIEHLLNSASRGWAYTFKLPSQNIKSDDTGKRLAYMTEFHIKAQEVGEPGSLRAHLVYEDDLNKIAFSDILSSSNPIIRSSIAARKALDDIASKPGELVYDISFIFGEGEDMTAVDTNKRLAIIFEPSGKFDGANYYSVWFSQNPDRNGDLQTLNQFYTYSKTLGSAALSYNSTSGDLLYRAGIRHIISNSDSHTDVGLYTKRMSAPISDAFNKVRVTMKVNKEGVYNITNAYGVVEGGDVINVERFNPEGGYMPFGVGDIFKNDDYVIVDESFGKCRDIKNSSFVLDNDIVIKKGSAAYRVGHKVSVRLRKTTIDSNGEEVVENFGILSLPLTRVVEDRNRRKKDASARLIFEAAIPAEAADEVNQFELQVLWDSKLTGNQINNNPEFRGTIEDIQMVLEVK